MQDNLIRVDDPDCLIDSRTGKEGPLSQEKETLGLDTITDDLTLAQEYLEESTEDEREAVDDKEVDGCLEFGRDLD